MLLVGIAVGVLGWTPGPVRRRPLVLAALVLGTVAFAGLGLLMAGTLRAEATLALANLLFLVSLVLGGIVLPLDRLPGAVAVGRGGAAARGADRQRSAIGLGSTRRATRRSRWCSSPAGRSCSPSSPRAGSAGTDAADGRERRSCRPPQPDGSGADRVPCARGACATPAPDPSCVRAGAVRAARGGRDAARPRRGLRRPVRARTRPRRRARRDRARVLAGVRDLTLLAAAVGAGWAIAGLARLSRRLRGLPAVETATGGYVREVVRPLAAPVPRRRRSRSWSRRTSSTSRSASHCRACTRSAPRATRSPCRSSPPSPGSWPRPAAGSGWRRETLVLRLRAARMSWLRRVVSIGATTQQVAPRRGARRPRPDPRPDRRRARATGPAPRLTSATALDGGPTPRGAPARRAAPESNTCPSPARVPAASLPSSTSILLASHASRPPAGRATEQPGLSPVMVEAITPPPLGVRDTAYDPASPRSRPPPDRPGRQAVRPRVAARATGLRVLRLHALPRRLPDDTRRHPRRHPRAGVDAERRVRDHRSRAGRRRGDEPVRRLLRRPVSSGSPGPKPRSPMRPVPGASATGGSTATRRPAMRWPTPPRRTCSTPRDASGTTCSSARQRDLIAQRLREVAGLLTCPPHPRRSTRCTPEPARIAILAVALAIAATAAACSSSGGSPDDHAVLGLVSQWPWPTPARRTS